MNKNVHGGLILNEIYQIQDNEVTRRASDGRNELTITNCNVSLLSMLLKSLMVGLINELYWLHKKNKGKKFDFPVVHAK